MRRRHQSAPVLLAGLLALFGGAPTNAQNFPSKPIRLVVANSPGTTLDTVARFMATELGQALGQTVVVENKPGAGFAIGYEFVAKAAPDGHTLGIVIMQDLAILPLISKELRFDPLKDLPAFIGMGEGRLVLGTAAKHSWKTYNELIAYAKANPGKLNYGSSGAQTRLPMESIVGRMGLKAVHVPYPGGAPFFLALASGDVHMGFVGEGTMVTLGEKFRPLGVTGDRRLASLPNVPTFAQLGQPQIRGINMTLNVAAATPRPIVEKLYQTSAKLLARADIKDRFGKVRYEVAVQSPEVAARKLVEESRLYADIAAKAGIRPQ